MGLCEEGFNVGCGSLGAGAGNGVGLGFLVASDDGCCCVFHGGFRLVTSGLAREVISRGVFV